MFSLPTTPADEVGLIIIDATIETSSRYGQKEGLVIVVRKTVVVVEDLSLEGNVGGGEKSLRFKEHPEKHLRLKRCRCKQC